MLLEDIITMATIYKIWSEKGDKVYIGSTSLDLLRRLSSHRCPSNCAYSKLLFQEYGTENCKMDVIEEVKEDERDERERYWICFYGEKAVNKIHPGRTGTEYRRETGYYQSHKEQKAKQDKEYREKNRERINAYDKERNATRIRCEVCDKDYRRDSIGKHLKSKKHLDKVKQF